MTGPDFSPPPAEQWQEVGHVGVDSGQITLVDASYLDCGIADPRADQLGDLERLGAGADIVSVRNRLPEAGAGAPLDLGVIVTAGLGDGWYPVEVRYWTDPLGPFAELGRRVAELRVVFIPAEGPAEILRNVRRPQSDEDDPTETMDNP